MGPDPGKPHRAGAIGPISGCRAATDRLRPVERTIEFRRARDLQAIFAKSAKGVEGLGRHLSRVRPQPVSIQAPQQPVPPGRATLAHPLMQRHFLPQIRHLLRVESCHRQIDFLAREIPGQCLAGVHRLCAQKTLGLQGGCPFRQQLSDCQIKRFCPLWPVAQRIGRDELEPHATSMGRGPTAALLQRPDFLFDPVPWCQAIEM